MLGIYFFMYLHAPGFSGWKFLLFPSKEMLHEVYTFNIYTMPQRML